jgi:hypothetical protein
MQRSKSTSEPAPKPASRSGLKKAVKGAKRPRLPSSPTVGKIHPKGTLFFREAVGIAADDADIECFEMAVGVGDRSPITRSAKTGNWWVLDWQTMIRLALAAGIDEE